MGTKTCKGCREPKDTTDFYFNSTARDGGNICKACKRLRDARYRDRNREKVRAACTAFYENPENRRRRNEGARAASRAKRKAVLARYGGKCACCDEDEYEFLTIDHINGGGTRHRASDGRKIVRFLIKNGYPEGFRVLCWNCNSAIGLHGRCPCHRHLCAGGAVT